MHTYTPTPPHTQVREIVDHIGAQHRGSELNSGVDAGSSSFSFTGGEGTASPPPPRQTLFFSATWPRGVQTVARALCRNDPVRIFVGGSERKLVANRGITQRVQVKTGQGLGASQRSNVDALQVGGMQGRAKP